MASVAFTEIKKDFGKTKVLHGISLDISDGEFMVLVGPSGCGKSTLLRMLAGLENITGGSIAIDGRVVNDLDSKDRDIAMVFQSYALYPHMTVRENMGFSLRLRKESARRIAEGVSRAAKILNLEPYLDRYPRVQMRSEIKALHQRLKTTTVYVTHDQVEAMTMADRIAVMNEGRIEQLGEPLELYDRPANLFVAQFIGSPAMNVFEGVYKDNAVDALRAHWPVAHTNAKQGQAVKYGIRPEHLTLH